MQYSVAHSIVIDIIGKAYNFSLVPYTGIVYSLTTF